MSDMNCIPDLIKRASDSEQLVAAQHLAAKRLLNFDEEVFPSDGCAITLSVLLQQCSIAVADVYKAIDLGDVLLQRGWKKIAPGEQQPGDIGSTCGPTARHGNDHIYLVLKVLNSDEMVIADNQASQPHFRFATGKGKTPTTFFLRATV